MGTFRVHKTKDNTVMSNHHFRNIDEIVAIMVETVMFNRAMIQIAGGDYPFSVVAICNSSSIASTKEPEIQKSRMLSST